VLGGIIVFASTDIEATIGMFTTGYEAMMKDGIDSALGIQQSIVNTPDGRVFAVGFLWSSDDLPTGKQYLEKIIALGEVVRDTVRPRSVTDWMAESSSLVPQSAYGTIRTLSLRSITEDVINAISCNLARMPQDPATLISIHQSRDRPSLSTGALPSVFGAREPHYMVELIATAGTPETASAAHDWALMCRDALRETNASNILNSTYISLTPPAEADARKIFGLNWNRLMLLKAYYDPDNVFSNALPQLNLPLSEVPNE
jgi:hypothetical protein